MVTGSGPRTTRSPSASKSRRPVGRRAFVDPGDDVEAASALAGILHHRDGDRAHEHISSVRACSRAASSSSLTRASRKLSNRSKSLARGGRQRRWAR